MILIKEDVRIYLSLEPIDMRKAIDGLTALVVDVLEENPQSGHIFLFRNKQGNKVKALCWDRNGFIMYYKRLEKGRFMFPREALTSNLEINEEQLGWLFAGLDFMTMGQFPELNFNKFY